MEYYTAYKTIFANILSNIKRGFDLLLSSKSRIKACILTRNKILGENNYA